MSDWVVIEEFPRYSVNPWGQVRNDRTDRILAPRMNQFGLVYVGMMGSDGLQHQRSLALLVVSTFLPQDLPAFNTPINLDGDRWNCALDNLMWRPRAFAIRYHMQFRRRYPFPIDVPLREINTNEIYRNSWEVCIRFGLLERDLVESIEHRTYVWPTYQQFDLAD